jgi:protoporphyrinogen/coproporphyrinogen III oxidase
MVDVGAEAFIARRREVSALLDELGLAARQVGTTGVRPLIYCGGRLHQMPEGTLQGIPAEASALAGLVDDETIRWMLDERKRPMAWDRAADPSVADVVGGRFGEQVVARSVDPLLAGVYAGSAATIGLRSALPTLAAALDRGAPNLTDAVRDALAGLAPVDGSVFGAVDGGYAVLLDELVSRAQFDWARVAVERVEPTADGWQVVDDEGARWSADAVVLAVPAPALPGLIDGIAPRSASAARRIAVASTVLVVLALPGGTPLPQQSGVLVATGERLHAKAVTLTSRKWGRRGNVELVRLSFGRFGDAAESNIARNVGDEQLLEWAAKDLVALFGVRQEPVDSHVQRWIDAMPQYGPGHLDLVAELRAGLPAGLAVAGGYLDGIGVPACVASGTRAAASLTATDVGR